MSAAADALSSLGAAQLRIDEELKVLCAEDLDADSEDLKVQDHYYELEDILTTVSMVMTRLSNWLGL